MKKLIFVFGMIAVVTLTSVNVHAQNRPMSSQAKGAIIGGAGGALLGALVGKDVKSTLIGAAIGAGGGYIIGNEHQKNQDRRAAVYRAGYRNGYYTNNRQESAYRTRYYNTRNTHRYYDNRYVSNYRRGY